MSNMSKVDILQLPESSHQESSNFDPEHGFGGAFAPAETRQVQVLLWDYVKTLLQEAEQEEVQRALGAAAIEENEQLFREAASLEEILGDLQRGGEKQAEVRRLFETPARSLVSFHNFCGLPSLWLAIVDLWLSCEWSCNFENKAPLSSTPSVHVHATTATMSILTRAAFRSPSACHTMGCLL